MVQMAMIPKRIRTRCQDSSSRDWSVDINVINILPAPILQPLTSPADTLSPKGEGEVSIIPVKGLHTSDMV